MLQRFNDSFHQALELIGQWVKENGLMLHPTKTRIVDATQKGGFDSGFSV